MTRPSLQIVIQAAPPRRAEVAGMVARLRVQLSEAAGAGYRVSLEPLVSMDEEKIGCWPNGRRGVLRSLDTGAEAVLTLQDDVSFIADLPQVCCEILSAFPMGDRVYSLFLPRQAVEAARDAGARWLIQKRANLWGQATLMPSWLWRQAIDWIDAHEADRGSVWKHHDDSRIVDFCLARRYQVWTPIPNLVQHLQDVMPSLLRHNGPVAARMSSVFAGEDARLSGINWRDGSVYRE